MSGRYAISENRREGISIGWSTVEGLLRQRTLPQQRTDFFKLLLTHVAGVTLSHHNILGVLGKIVNTF